MRSWARPGAAHRSLEEKILVKLDDPSHPINRVFGGKGFEFTEDIPPVQRGPLPAQQGPRSVQH